MKKLIVFLIAGMFALGLGCPHNEYSITMSPEGNSLSRTTASRTVNDSPSTSSQPTSEPQWKISSEGKYAGQLPSAMPDSGFANYAAADSPAGKLCLYFERFGNSADAGVQVQKALNNIDILTDIILDCCKEKYSSHPEYEKLRTFFDKDFREDYKNVFMILWVGCSANSLTKDGSSSSYDLEYMFTRVGFYLFERGYFTADDITLLPQVENLKVLVSVVIDRKIGLSDQKLRREIIEYLDALSGQNEARRLELSELISKSPTAKKYAAGEEATTKPADPCELFSQNALLPFCAPLGLGSDHMDVTLELKSTDQPLFTNGRFENGKITWARSTGDSRFPVMFHAVWTIPDEEFQKKHFGKVVMRDGALAKLCIWEKSLSQSQRAEWREFLSTLTSETLEEKLSAFRFKTPSAVRITATSQSTSQPYDAPADGAKMIMTELAPTPIIGSQPASQSVERQ